MSTASSMALMPLENWGCLGLGLALGSNYGVDAPGELGVTDGTHVLAPNAHWVGQAGGVGDAGEVVGVDH